MNLHDWIDEVCDLLDIEAEADEALLADLAEVAVDNVHASAGPVTAFLLGVAAGGGETDPERIEAMAARVQALAEAWDRPAGAVDETDEDPEADELVDATAPDSVTEADEESLV
ncbi:DUF6457 domain-containing protein [Nocardioides sambongensis]|uniref:DUF6457 domain-containing protein n=1 Tax=Nocardioides sambongensis TaxID=2589074 RepID=UPI00112E933A|nr:DUF6457 domain-containing protein [Nocardioides sambongensis]